METEVPTTAIPKEGNALPNTELEVERHFPYIIRKIRVLNVLPYVFFNDRRRRTLIPQQPLRTKQALFLQIPQKKQHPQGNTKEQKNKGKEKLQLHRAQSLRTRMCLPPMLPWKSLYQNGDWRFYITPENLPLMEKKWLLRKPPTLNMYLCNQGQLKRHNRITRTKILMTTPEKVRPMRKTTIHLRRRKAAWNATYQHLHLHHKTLLARPQGVYGENVI